MPKKSAAGKRKSKSYRRANHDSGVRMVRLVDQMPRHAIGRRLYDVAGSLGVSERTVKSYIKALNYEFTTENGEPQFVVENRGGEQWIVRRDWLPDQSQMQIYQLIPIYLAREIFLMLGANNLLVGLVDSVLQDVESGLSSTLWLLIKGLPLKFYSAPFVAQDYSACTDQLEDVIMALIYQRIINIKYQKPGEQAEDYTVKPLTLLFHQGGLYLIAMSPKHDQPVYLNIECMISVEVTSATFKYPAKYHPEQMLDGAFVISTGPARTFRLKFAPQLKDYIKSRTWHKSQKIRELKNGSIILTLKVADSEEIREWIRGFGEGVEEI